METHNLDQRQSVTTTGKQNETILRDIRDVSLASIPPDGTVGSNEYSTPPWLCGALFGRFKPNLDVAATPMNAKCPRYYALERGQNGLELPWEGRVFSNPPYDDAGAWAAKAVKEIRNGNAEIVVMALPAFVSSAWFHQHVIDCPFCEWIPLKGRVAFGGLKRNPYGTVVAIWRRPEEAAAEPIDRRELRDELFAARQKAMDDEAQEKAATRKMKRR